jgi:hypothetical protein
MTRHTTARLTLRPVLLQKTHASLDEVFSIVTYTM